jgi:hypothetical protein
MSVLAILERRRPKDTEVTAEEKQFRFATGSQGDPCSSIWRIWTQGDEAYLTVRNFASLAKLSLHANGYWPFRVANTIVPYRRPFPYREGWTRGPGIVVPHNDLDVHLPYFDARPRDKVNWLDQPKPAWLAQFLLQFVDPSVSKVALQRSPPDDAALLTVLKLRSGGRLCVYRRDRASTVDELNRVTTLRRIVESQSPGATPARVFGISNISVQPDSHGQPLLTETQMRPPGAP